MGKEMNKTILRINSLLLVTILSFAGLSSSQLALASVYNQTAVFLANRWSPIGQAWSGNHLIPAPEYSFDGKGKLLWGRTQFPMPDATLAIQSGYNIPATEITSTKPLYYCVIFLDAQTGKDDASLTEKCFVVLDSAGQLWFDTEGNFEDCRYYGYSNPVDPNYNNDPNPTNTWDEIDLNPNCYVDPSQTNNTQGPYYIVPTKSDGSLQPLFSQNTETYFRFDKEDFEGWIPTPVDRIPPTKTRLFQIGWIDIPDFPLIQDNSPSNDYPVIPSIGTTLKPRSVNNSAIPRWDLGLRLVSFINDGDNQLDQNEEWHAENVNPDGRFTPAEWIYRRTSIIFTSAVVASGDLRLSDVIILASNGEPRIYKAGTSVNDTGTIGVLDQGDDLDVGRTLIPFIHGINVTPGDELHTENVILDSSFNFCEFIYRKGDNIPFVTQTDSGLTDINTNQRRFENIQGDGICSLGGINPGDLFIMVEILKAGPKSPSYNLVVQTDIWNGLTPSTMVASLFDPQGKPLTGAQQINKSTSLDADPAVFNLSSTTFFNIKPNFRSYFGISIFNDNGIDNCLGPMTDVTPLNLSSDYYPAKRAEAFIGAKASLDCPDAGRTIPMVEGQEGLYPFSSIYRLIDDGSSSIGCQRTIYKKQKSLGTTVEAGDLRLTRVSASRGGGMAIYQPGTTVSPGDLDVGINLINFPSNFCFFDQHHGEILPNGEFDPGEDVYCDTNGNMAIDFGDVRMSRIQIGYYNYECGDIVDEWGLWVHEYEIHGLTKGRCGSSTGIDIPVIPGPVGLSVYVDRYLRVEQTSKIIVKTELPLKKTDKIYISIKSQLTMGKIPWEETKILTVESPELLFEYTPYLGSLFPDGHFDPIVVTAFAEIGGIEGRPAPPCGSYQDPYILTKYMPSANLQDIPNLKTTIPIPAPQTTTSGVIEDDYDAYEKKFLSVSAERLEIVSTRKCIETLEERYPNISIETYDGDNTADVNDPCCIPFALGKNENTIVLFNAIGAGVNWMATAIGGSGQRYIIQYNTDHTFYFWYWNDIGPIPGALDSGDFVGNNPGYVPPNFVGTQQPIEVSYQASFIDSDASGQIATPSNDDDGFVPWGLVTKYDKIGIFDGLTIDAKTSATFGTIETFGIPTYITCMGFFTDYDQGGWALGLVKPKESSKTIKLRLSSFNLLFDYNSSLTIHPPNFLFDDHLALDYTGTVSVKILPVDPILNFSEFTVIDHGLQFSNIDYTAGENTVDRRTPPVPQIQHPYYPLLRNLQDDFRVYPGGQTHLGRIVDLPFTRGFVHGWNAYPAIWSEWGQRFNKSRSTIGRDPEEDKYNHTVNFNKLGTEFFPLTDYGIYFVLKDGFGRHYTFDPNQTIGSNTSKNLIRRIKVTGPFKRPKIMNAITGRVTTDFAFGGMIKLPIIYDFSGEIIVDNTNYRFYEFPGKNWIGEIGYGLDTIRFLPDEWNGFLAWNHRLDYKGVENVFKIDELTPVGNGKIEIEVTLFDGQTKKFQDCCNQENVFGIAVHGLSITGLPDKMAVGQDYHLDVKVTEIEDMQFEQACNDAFVYIWQDRGIAFSFPGIDEPIHMGMGDGRTMGTPDPGRNSSRREGAMYSERQDFNEDGKISFEDYETEIVGTYYFATNSWAGGMVDGRTFNRNNGTYHFDLTAAENCQIVDIGMDIGGLNARGMRRFVTPADHCISENEETSVYVTAFKYGDDNNDRSWTPYYYNDYFQISYTHEVYLAGEARAPIAPKDDYTIEVSPQPLTAGVVNELVDPTKPFTVRVTDSKGRPVNLLEGVRDFSGDNEVPPERAQMNLFCDWHPDQEEYFGFGSRLPQYYWIRTDLHNESADYYQNIFLYSDYNNEQNYFEPITIDFDRANQGIYIFKGFCANDAGEFYLTVYSPDRKFMGTTKVVVNLPIAEYQVVNYVDPEKKMFTSPGEPDFILTAGSNKIYEVNAVFKNCQGKLIAQPPKELRVCNSKLTYPAHFTPFITVPANQKPRSWFPCEQCHDNYSLHIAFDWNENGVIENGGKEIYKFGSLKTQREFFAWDNDTQAISIYRRNQPLSYVTSNMHYSDNTFSPKNVVMLSPLYEPVPTSWGVGCIYNNPYGGCYYFVDRNEDAMLDFNDFLPLDDLGACRFYIFAEDVCEVGGLIGCNPYTADVGFNDVAGAPMNYYTDPGFTYMRYRYFTNSTGLIGSDLGSRDGSYKLDWDAMPATTLSIKSPKLVMRSARTGFPLDSSLFAPKNYDLMYACENHILIELHPADDRDLVMDSNSYVMATGNEHELLCQGSFAQMSSYKMPVTYLDINPQGQGIGTIQIGYKSKNKFIGGQSFYLSSNDSPSYYSIYPIAYLDSSPGLEVSVLSPDTINTDVLNILEIRVVDQSTRTPIDKAFVRVKGEDVDTDGYSDGRGIVRIEISPKIIEKIVITAEAEGFVPGETIIYTGQRIEPPTLNIDPYPTLVNKSLFTFKGKTIPGAIITVNGKPIQVNPDGSFTGRIQLVEETNVIQVISTLPNVPQTSKQIVVTLDTIPPAIMLPKLPELIGSQKFILRGRVEPRCEVYVNNEKATVVYDIFEIQIQLKPGKNVFQIESIDPAGNTSSENFEIPVYAKGWGKLVVGAKEIWNENGDIIGVMQISLNKDGFIPVDALRIIFGGSFEIKEAVNICILEIFDTTYLLEADSINALVNGKPIVLPENPILTNGSFFVSQSFLKEILACTVTFDMLKGEIIIGRVWLP